MSMSGENELIERARAFTDAFAEPGNQWRAQARELILALLLEVDQLTVQRRRTIDLAKQWANSENARTKLRGQQLLQALAIHRDDPVSLRSDTPPAQDSAEGG